MSSPRILVLLGTLGLVSMVASANFTATPPFHAQVYTTIPNPRGIYKDDAGDILVVSRGQSQVIVLYETENEDGSRSVIKTVLLDRPDLNLDHGLTYRNGYLYASNSTHVFRWVYESGSRLNITVQEEIVVQNIPDKGSYGHGVRALAIDTEGHLYITVGADTNIDEDSRRARLRRVDLRAGIPDGGFDFEVAELFADGLRNSLGIGFDLSGILWGVENGATFDRSENFTDYYQGNPSEEMNRYAYGSGTNYGYPFCFSTFQLLDYEPNTQFAWPSFLSDGIHTDEWCRNMSNNRPPALSMPAHAAPLGITYYDGSGCDVVPGAFPCSFRGDAVVSFHGSSGDIQGLPGYKASLFSFDRVTELPTGDSIDVIYDPSPYRKTFRPAGAVFDLNGHLFVTSDTSDEVFRIYYDLVPPAVLSAEK